MANGTTSALRLALEIAAAGSPAPHWTVVGDALRNQTDVSQEEVCGLVWAFVYRHTHKDDADGQAVFGDFGPMLQTQDGVYPPPLATVESRWLDLWETLADSPNPVISSRLNDLLWARKWQGDKKSHEYARAAAEAYFALVTGDWEPIYRIHTLGRIFQLARALNDEQLLYRAIAAAETLARESMVREELQPGVTMGALRLLTGVAGELQPSILPGLLDEATVVYRDNMLAYPQLMDLRISLVSEPATRTAMQKAKFERFIEEANRSTGLARLTPLRQAHEVAVRHGLGDEAKEVELLMQQVQPAAGDFAVLESEVGASRDEMEAVYSSFVDAGSWHGALELLGAHIPIADEPTARARTEELYAAAPLPLLVTNVLYGPGRRPVRYAQLREDNLRLATARMERLSLELWAEWAADILDRIRDQYGEPTEDDLTVFFAAPHIGQDVARRFARGALLFWRGDYDECAHVVVPRIERTIRSICESGRLLIYRQPVQDRDGQYFGLGRLLNDMLAHGMWGNEALGRYLKALLTDTACMNLRDELCHGLLSEARRGDAALVVHVACMLRLLRKNEPDSEDSACSS